MKYEKITICQMRRINEIEDCGENLHFMNFFLVAFSSRLLYLYSWALKSLVKSLHHTCESIQSYALCRNTKWCYNESAVTYMLSEILDNIRFRSSSRTASVIIFNHLVQNNFGLPEISRRIWFIANRFKLHERLTFFRHILRIWK